MAKLNRSDRLNICTRYLRDECITFDDLARSYRVSRSTISNAVHKAIAECEVSEKEALRIMDKAVSNVQRKLNEMNKKGSAKKTIEKFEESIAKAQAKREKLAASQLEKDKEIRDLCIHIEQIDFNIMLLEDRIARYDDIYSSSDENDGITKECLESQLEKQKQKKHDFEMMLEEIKNR